MKIIIAALFLASVVAFAQGNFAINKLPESSLDSRVHNGIPAVDGQFPYQAFLEIKNINGYTVYCSGALIGKSWVLTTAHCIRIAESIRVYLGSVNHPDSTLIVTSDTFTRHAFYDGSGSENDIGIIALPVIVSETEHIKVINFAKSDETFDGETGIVSGFGNKTSFAGALNYVKANILPIDECSGYFTSNSRICSVGYPKPENQACNDHGSPLVVYRDNKPLLVGLVNFNMCRSAIVHPTGYTRVSSFADWIAEKSGIA